MTQPVTDAPASELPPRLRDANLIVAKHAKWAAITGLVPIPFIDFAVIIGIQVRMVKELCALYGVEFRDNLGKTAVTATIGGTVPVLVMSSAAKLVPFVGALGAMAFTPAVAATTTYAAGCAFIDHFETGGSLLSFHPGRMRSYFERHTARRRAEAEAAR